jgi:hypothetical protein
LSVFTDPANAGDGYLVLDGYGSDDVTHIAGFIAKGSLEISANAGSDLVSGSYMPVLRFQSDGQATLQSDNANININSGTGNVGIVSGTLVLLGSGSAGVTVEDAGTKVSISNTLRVGPSGSAADTDIEAWNDMTNLPKLRYNRTGSKWQYSNDGTTFSDMGSGAGAWGDITGTLSDQTDLQTALDGKSDTGHNHDSSYYTETETDTLLAAKQATLVSGTNIKTINGSSVLGSGDLTVSGGGGTMHGVVLNHNVDSLGWASFASVTGSGAYSVGGTTTDMYIELNTSSSANSGAKIGTQDFVMGGWTGNISFSAGWGYSPAGSDMALYVGIGTVGGTVVSPTFNQNHMGYKRMDSGSVFELYATNGSTSAAANTATSISNPGSNVMYFAKKTGTSSIKFYTGSTSALTLRATHTTNIPADGSVNNGLIMQVSNKTVAASTVVRIRSLTVFREVES